MKKGYYWIKPVDNSINGEANYGAYIKGDIFFDIKRRRIVFSLDRFFPVGSIFHFIHTEDNYIITKRLRKPGLWYEARREDDAVIGKDDMSRFTSGRMIYRDGFAHCLSQL